MAFFTTKNWLNRVSQFPTRRRLTITSSSESEIVATVARDEGTVSQTGDAFSANNMNNLENRILTAFNSVNTSINNVKGMVEGSDDEYKTNKSYSTGDFVIQDNKVYRCTSPCNAGTWASNSSHFTRDTLTNAISTIKKAVGFVSKGSKTIVRIGNDSGTWQLFGSSVFDSSTTLQDIITYLNTNNVSADMALITSNSHNNAYNNSLPITTGSVVEIVPYTYAYPSGSWDRGYVRVSDFRTGNIYTAGIVDATLTAFKQVAYYGSSWNLVTTTTPALSEASGDVKIYKNDLLRRIHIDANVTLTSSVQGGTAFAFINNSNLIVPPFTTNAVFMAKDTSNNYIPVIISKNTTNNISAISASKNLPAGTTINVQFEYSY